MANADFTNLRRPRGAQYLGLQCTPLLASFAIGGPFGLRGAVKRAWPRIPGWDRQSAYGPTRGRVFQSCNSTWQRCHNTEIIKKTRQNNLVELIQNIEFLPEGSFFYGRQWIWPSLFCP